MWSTLHSATLDVNELQNVVVTDKVALAWAVIEGKQDTEGVSVKISLSTEPMTLKCRHDHSSEKEAENVAHEKVPKMSDRMRPLALLTRTDRSTRAFKQIQ